MQFYRVSMTIELYLMLLEHLWALPPFSPIDKSSLVVKGSMDENIAYKLQKLSTPPVLLLLAYFGNFGVLHPGKEE